MKRLLSCILAFALISNLSPVVFAAKNDSVGWITVKTECSDSAERFVAVVHENTIYVSAEDIGTISGYELDGLDTFSIGNSDSYLTYRRGASKSITTAISVYGSGAADAMGETVQLHQLFEIDGTLYLPLEEMLYLTHAQWTSSSDTIYVEPLGANILDFSYNNFVDIVTNAPSQNDLLVNGQSQLDNSIKSVLASVVADFDSRLLIPFWGVGEIMREEYAEALQQLNIPDESFLDDYGISQISTYMSDSFNDTGSKYADIAQSLAGMPEDTQTIINSFGELTSEITKLSPNLKFRKWNDISALTIPELQAISREAEEVGDIFSIFDIAATACEIAGRSNEWSSEFIEQLSILASADTSMYNSTGEDIINVARDLLSELNNPAESTIDSIGMNVIAFMEQKLFDKTPVGILVSSMVFCNTVMELSDDNWADTVSAYQLCSVANAMTKTSVIASRICSYDNSNAIGIIVNGNAEQSIQKYRNSLNLLLKICLRDCIYIYYLNSKLNTDTDWENSMDGIAWKNRIAQYYAWILELESTKERDCLLIVESLDSMYSNEYGLCREKLDCSLVLDSNQGQVAGTITDSDSLIVLNGATVTVTDSEENTVETATTSDSNKYSFSLPAGTYTITVELPGYETASKVIHLPENDALNVDFSMNSETEELTYKMQDMKFTVKAADGTEVYYDQYSYPVFSGSDCERLNEYFTNIIDDFGFLTKDSENGDALIEEYLETGYDAESLPNYLPFYREYAADITYVDDVFISYTGTKGFWSGGVHPYYYSLGAIVERATGKEISYLELFSEGKSLESIVEAYDVSGQIRIYDGFSPESYYLTEEGLVLCFNQGDAVERISLIIPFKELTFYNK